MNSVFRIRDDRLHEVSPTDIYSGVVVGFRLEAARLAAKVVSALSVSRAAMAALRTQAGCVTRINEVDQHPGKECLVLYEASELPIGPRFVSGALRFTNSYPLPEVSQVLQSYSSTRVFRLAHQPLRDAMVCVFSKTCFSAGKLLKMAFRGLRARRLELRADTFVPLARLLDLLPGIGLAIGVARKVDDAEIDSECPGRVIRLWFGSIHGKHQIERAAGSASPVEEVGLAFASVHPGFLVVSEPDRDKLTPFEGQKANSIEPLEAHHPLVVGHRTVLAECWLLRLVSLEDLRDFGDAAYRHLSGKPKAAPHLVVDQALKLVLRGGAVLERHARYPVRRLVKAFERFEQGAMLFFGRRELNHDYQFHVENITRNAVRDNGRFWMANFDAAPFLPRLKHGGILEHSR